MEVLNVDEIKTLNDNKIIITIDNEFKIVFRTIIQKVLRLNNGVPLDWEDLYYSFLYETPKLIKEYDKTAGITLKSFLGLRCKWFSHNKCKIYSSNKHKVLNRYISIDKSGAENTLRDSVQPLNLIDISKLTKDEVIIYNDFFLDGSNPFEIHKKRGISRYKVKKLIEQVKVKLLIQIKN